MADAGFDERAEARRMAALVRIADRPFFYRGAPTANAEGLPPILGKASTGRALGSAMGGSGAASRSVSAVGTPRGACAKKMKKEGDVRSAARARRPSARAERGPVFFCRRVAARGRRMGQELPVPRRSPVGMLRGRRGMERCGAPLSVFSIAEHADGRTPRDPHRSGRCPQDAPRRAASDAALRFDLAPFGDRRRHAPTVASRKERPRARARPRSARARARRSAARARRRGSSAARGRAITIQAITI